MSTTCSDFFNCYKVTVTLSSNSSLDITTTAEITSADIFDRVFSLLLAVAALLSCAVNILNLIVFIRLIRRSHKLSPIYHILATITAIDAIFGFWKCLVLVITYARSAQSTGWTLFEKFVTTLSLYPKGYTSIVSSWLLTSALIIYLSSTRSTQQ